VMMSVLVWSFGVLAALLFLYSLLHYMAATMAALRWPVESKREPQAQGAISVLIPARDEGERALRVIRSLLAQDYTDFVEIWLLLEDANDSALPSLRAAFPEASLADVQDDAEVVTLFEDDSRRVRVGYTRCTSKSARIRWAVPRLESAHVAILDADHIARVDWLSSALGVLRSSKARLVQGVRLPTRVLGFFSLWDSLHQHVGCEVFNHVFTRMGLSVFFTGTTAVMETSVLREHPLRDCITEDVDLSYTLLFEGDKVAHDPVGGSYEETSPDLYSFVARRRRWAAGHTRAFLSRLRLVPGAKIRKRDRLQFLLHGAHYLLALPVFLLHLAIALLFAFGMAPPALACAGFLGLAVAWMFLRGQGRSSLGHRVFEWLVLSAWFVPAVLIATNVSIAMLSRDPTRAALPVPASLALLGLVGFLGPLAVLLVGLARQRQVGVGSLTMLILSYPLAFYLDVAGVLLGLVDAAFGQSVWRPVGRAKAQEAANEDAPLALHGLRESCSLRGLFAASRGRRLALASHALRPSRSLPSLFGAVVFSFGVLYAPPVAIPFEGRPCETLEHDGDPWIVPEARMGGSYCPEPAQDPESHVVMRSGSFRSLRHDTLRRLDRGYWDRLDTTFFCNQAVFAPENLLARPGGGLDLRLRREERGDRHFTAASFATKDREDARFLYGRFEVVMKPSRVSGVLSAFFLYRFDPWQEIDAEFVGKDTTKLLFNVYYNPGREGDLYNYGFRGTPVRVDLGFDAADDFHRYTIEWDPSGLRFFVDGRLVHHRPAGLPTPVPHLPMRFHVNVWPTCSEELAGPLDASALPTQAEVREVNLWSWHPAPLTRVENFFRSLIQSDDASGWRRDAGWIR